MRKYKKRNGRRSEHNVDLRADKNTVDASGGGSDFQAKANSTRTLGKYRPKESDSASRRPTRPVTLMTSTPLFVGTPRDPFTLPSSSSRGISETGSIRSWWPSSRRCHTLYRHTLACFMPVSSSSSLVRHQDLEQDKFSVRHTAFTHKRLQHISNFTNVTSKRTLPRNGICAGASATMTADAMPVCGPTAVRPSVRSTRSSLNICILRAAAFYRFHATRPV